ncbi:hypothetical protein A2Y99_00410 [Candidatus Gottesmanbacteria bacterium RBG_13_37_7]|uniref:Glycosyltransferase 2-like domain-containing protein n=1 Tax=Candidatus Gottesmanbacteria bacterium RBG_13_37_7 TaxID=1798369 RepID=A0A1F5YIT7_9BACT|nr:MAG: hypothetical protein A2Y99_00410 [Candidatus Gottesmanbacteria bacterium RBG_13_37_7]
MITVIILTKNEENNIVRCLESLVWCDRIIIVDDYSEDKTIERIKKYESTYLRLPAQVGRQGIRNIEILKRKLSGDFATQRNFALSKVKNGWVLFIDADEEVSGALTTEIKEKINIDSCNGWFIRRVDNFMGRRLYFGETGNISFIRLGKKDVGRWHGRVHETWQIKGKTGKLENTLTHYPHPGISEFLADINFFTDIVAQYWKEQGRVLPAWEIVFFPLGKFLKNYFFKLGFLDGNAGFIMAAMMSFHSFLVRSKYWLSKQS